jgi:succinate dehydrogenase / fumarate reductase, flavoprotein subunit
MPDLDKIGQVYSTDLLVLGAGLAGFIVANRIKELNPNLSVLMIEKSTAGFAGAKANKGAGVMWVMQEDDDIDKFRDYYCKYHGHFLEDQELLEKTCLTTPSMVEHFERWGVEIKREVDGKLSRMEAIPLWSLCAYDLNVLEKLRRIALNLGVKTLDKTQFVEILTDGNRAVGAVGFDLVSGEYRIFKAKAVVLATGACDWMLTNMWYSGRGDGIAAAYRAGAEMRNAEYSNFYNLGIRGNMSAIAGGQYALYNSDGEYLAPKYCADFEVDIDIGILLGMEKEVMEGKGPIVYEETEMFIKNPLAVGGFLFKWERPVADKFWHTLMAKEAKFNADRAWRPEVYPMFIGECSCVKVNHDMQTNLEGLWALGDTCRTGSAVSGAVPHPCRIRGSGITWATVSALHSENSISTYLAGATDPQVNPDQVNQFKTALFSPMSREKGLSPREGIWRLQQVISPPRYSIRKNQRRMEEALAEVNNVLQLAETEVSPSGDWHLLGLCHDLKNMAQCADLYFTSSLTRQESRGWHHRDDFPNRDDVSWRKWITIKKDNGAMVVSTEKMAVERYKTKPY